MSGFFWTRTCQNKTRHACQDFFEHRFSTRHVLKHPNVEARGSGSGSSRLGHWLGGLHYHAFAIVNYVTLMQIFLAINVCLNWCVTQMLKTLTVIFKNRTKCAVTVWNIENKITRVLRDKSSVCDIVGLSCHLPVKIRTTLCTIGRWQKLHSDVVHSLVLENFNAFLARQVIDVSALMVETDL